MSYQQSKKAYRNIVVGEGATQASLMQHVYHFLALDLLEAAKAVRAGDIEGRCAASNHALLLLGHLESWLDLLTEEPALQGSLQSFYVMLRVSVLQAQGQDDALTFERIAQHVLDMKLTWQQREQRGTPLVPADTAPANQRSVLSFCA